MRIYFDHNATTPPRPEVVRAVCLAMAMGCERSGEYGECSRTNAAAQTGSAAGASWANPSSPHAEGRLARDRVETARRQVAGLLGARPEEIIFTSGGTEGNNTALLGAAGRSGQVISSPLEHPSVKAPLSALGAERGVPIRWLPVDALGRIDPDDLQKALRDHPTALVSLSLCNHEIGNLYPIAELCRISHQHGALFHCDAVQGAGRVPIDVTELGVDLLTLSAHKLYGPKGIGALYCRGRTSLPPLLRGGQQEKGRRAGTENVPAIAGFGVACALAREALPGSAGHIAALRDRLEEQLLSGDQALAGAQRFGDPTRRAPGTSNLGFAGVEGELLMMNLDLRGAAVSTGAACSSGSTEPSPVLLALGVPRETALAAVRFSLGRGNTAEEVDQVAGWVRDSVRHIRSLS